MTLLSRLVNQIFKCSPRLQALASSFSINLIAYEVSWYKFQKVEPGACPTCAGSTAVIVAPIRMTSRSLSGVAEQACSQRSKGSRRNPDKR